MKYLDLTLPAPEANLACDEGLLDACDAGEIPGVLRVWESPRPFVVVGYANEVAREVNLDACRRSGVPVLRRCTGGGTVVQGPGCLNYGLCLRIEGDSLATITATNCYVMVKLRQMFENLLNSPVDIRGSTDLAVGERKFSGNAQRRKRSALLFHGSFLLDLDLKLIENLLRLPSKEPSYRAHRSHLDFLRTVPLAAAAVKEALRQAWGADEALTPVPMDTIAELARNKYAKPEWNFRF